MHSPLRTERTFGSQATVLSTAPDLSLTAVAAEHIVAALDGLAELAEQIDSLAALRLLSSVADQLEDARQDVAALGAFLRVPGTGAINTSRPM